MAALTGTRNTPTRASTHVSTTVADGETIHSGAMVMLNASGQAVAAKTATGLVGCGRAETRGTGGDQITVLKGEFRWSNSDGADAITAADLGHVCYAVDDQTVAKTDGGGTRSPAGFVEGVDGVGVWVRSDHAVIRLA